MLVFNCWYLSRENKADDDDLNPWSRILDEAQERHEVQLNALFDEYERSWDSENVAHLKAQNALLPLYRKELRKLLLEYL